MGKNDEWLTALQRNNAQEERPSDVGAIQLLQSSKLVGPIQVAFDLTNKCNFRCLHCYNLSGTNLVVADELEDNEVLKFIKEIAGMKIFNFCWCGGEPLMRQKLLCRATEILAESGVMVSLVTNGSLVTCEKVKILKKSGIRRVQVSLDGAKKETHERLRPFKNAFGKAIDAISQFLEAGYDEVMVAFTPTAFNYSEIDEVANLCEEMGVSFLRVQPLMILGRAQINIRELLPTAQQYRRLVGRIRQINQAIGRELIQWGDPVDHLIRFSTTLESCCPYVNIRANGDIVPSPYLPLVLGNLRNHPFKEYWRRGFARIWELPTVKEFAGMIHSTLQLGKHEEGAPNVWFDKDISLDFIDKKLFNSLRQISKN